MEYGRHEEALLIYQSFQALLPHSSYILSQIAVLQYNQKEYEASLQTFAHMRLLDPHKLETLDTFSNILYVKENSAALGNLARQAVKFDKFTPEACCIIGNYFSLKSEHEKAVTYFKRALALNRAFTPAWIPMGHEVLVLDCFSLIL